MEVFVSVLSSDSKAIVDGNLKLILGLIWTLILHYSISMPMWGDEDDEDARKLTPKQRLLGWIQNKVPQLPITNFHRDWRDGKALGALVDNCAPGGCKRAQVAAAELGNCQCCYSNTTPTEGSRCELCVAFRSVSRLGKLGPQAAGGECQRGHAAG